jgi:hypothetical protein
MSGMVRSAATSSASFISSLAALNPDLHRKAEATM